MTCQTIMTKNEIALTQERLCAQILETVPDAQNLLIIGIQRRGADLAKRLAEIIYQKSGYKLPTGSLDINLYRDDWSVRASGAPMIGDSHLPFSIDGREILLVDDVLFSGRTIRAALEAMFDYGRPAKVMLLAFIDRGHRELPICADYVGKRIATEKSQHVDVFFEERDNREEVCIS